MHIQRVKVSDNRGLAPLSWLAQPVSELYFSGDFLELLNRPLVAIVGSRKVSDYGETVAHRLASELSRAGVVIVSGLALGMDSIAHRAALEVGGKTIAVLPTGLNRIYPAQHYGLAQSIISQGGAVVSEVPPSATSLRKYQFIARNRIIAALSRGVVIPEAAAKSGSLHTAQFALDQGLEVLAVPGNITSPTSEGTNQLIKSGATPVTRTQDILDALTINATAISEYTPANPTERSILDTIKQSPRTTAELLWATKLDMGLLQQALTMLEMQGVIGLNTVGVWRVT